MAIVRDIMASFAVAAQDKGIQCYIQGEDNLSIELDRAKFVRILSNLIANAFKFTPVGGRISCRVERLNAERLLISVQDNGAGVNSIPSSRISSTVLPKAVKNSAQVVAV